MIKSGTMYALAMLIGVLGVIGSIVIGNVFGVPNPSDIGSYAKSGGTVFNWIAMFAGFICTAFTCVIWVFFGTVLQRLEALQPQEAEKQPLPIKEPSYVGINPTPEKVDLSTIKAESLWNCDKCGYRNASTRITCQSCSAPRIDS